MKKTFLYCNKNEANPNFVKFVHNFDITSLIYSSVFVNLNDNGNKFIPKI